MKTCTKCGETKDKSEFHKRNDNKTGLSSHCKECRNRHGKKWRAKNLKRESERGKKWYSRNKARCKEYARSHKLKTKYGLTVKEYDRILKSQEGVCACCQKEPPADRNLYVDHNHITGKVRGLLCLQCNVGIGSLGDDLDGVLRAVNYLLKSDS